MILSRLSSKGQITLPRKVRQALNIKPGDRVLFLVENETVRLQPVATPSARDLAGSLRGYAGARPAGLARGAAKKEVARAAAQEG
jgi:AbrB family looped-hinge helix DNA binding protein